MTTTSTSVLLMSLLVAAASQPLALLNGEKWQVLSKVECVKILPIKDSTLVREFQALRPYISEGEVPILAILRKGDTTHLFISALIGTYAIIKNPPTAIVKFANREALLYTGKGSLAKTSPKCFQHLLKKYATILHIDKVNAREGLKPGTSLGGSYDPILKEALLVNDKFVSIHSASRFPFFEYGD